MIVKAEAIQPATLFTFYRGRVALFAILRALGIGKGDSVAIPAFTCLAVPEAVMAAGARPIYVDIEKTGFNMDASDLERKLDARTRAIIIQHTYGIPADMRRIVPISSAVRLPLIEDCCHTLATTYMDKPVGSFGIASFYSYEWGKPVVVGIGGGAIVNQPWLLEKIRRQYKVFVYPETMTLARLNVQYVVHQLLYKPWLYWPLRSLYHLLRSVGLAETNYNPFTMGHVSRDFSLKMSKYLKQRLSGKLANLHFLAQNSRKIAKVYQTEINCPWLKHPICPEGSDTVFARYPLIARDKPAILAKAREAFIELADWYSTPVHPLCSNDLRAVHYQAGSCPQAEERCKQVITLPVHSGVSERDMRRAVRFLNRARI